MLGNIEINELLLEVESSSVSKILLPGAKRENRLGLHFAVLFKADYMYEP
jgi:hypothetical protein